MPRALQYIFELSYLGTRALDVPKPHCFAATSDWAWTPRQEHVSTSRKVEKGGRMPRRAWSDKRERQYEHVKEGLEDRGRPEDEAEEIAARTVNKERARSGEAREASPTSTEDISSGRRGGLRSHRGPGGRTRDQLYEEAREKKVKGRSKMTKQQLERAVGR